MRLRTFTAKTMPEAMALVRNQLGIDAVILSTGKVNGGISVTAALDQRETASGDTALAELALPDLPNDPSEEVHETLIAHGTPAPIVERVLTASLERGAPDAFAALAAGLDAVFTFAPLSE